MYSYYIHYKIICKDVQPAEIIESGVPITQEMPLSDPDNLKDFAAGLADTVAKRRGAPDGTIEVYILGFSKFDSPLISRIHVDLDRPFK